VVPSGIRPSGTREIGLRAILAPVALGLGLGQAACGIAGQGASTAPGHGNVAAPPSLREKGLGAPPLEGLSGSEGARILPEGTGKGQVQGVDPSGGLQLLVDGLRVLAFPDGSMVAAEDRFPSNPTSVVPVADRFGGGFLYALDRRVWRSESWLGKATGVVAAAWTIDRIVVGLDRIYLHSSQGALASLVAPADASGRWLLSRDLGPMPGGPHSGRFAATDAWHALAIGDLQGVLVTGNAGASWQRVPVPVAPTEVRLSGETLLVGGLDDARRTEWWEVRPDGQASVLPPNPDSKPSPEPSHAIADSLKPADPKTHPFGAVPLRAALEDGFPLVDGTALVLRDGTMGRVRVTDGKVVEAVADAFPLKPSRCHPLSLSSKEDPRAFGFVCGEPRGQTIVYRWDALQGRPVELRRFRDPREVLAFGNGALAARGPCTDPMAGAERASDVQTFCVMPPHGAWHAVSFRGDDADRARLAVLADGRVVVLRPPVGGDLSSARLAFVGDTRASEIALSIPTLGASISRVLREGIWRDGFEERRPGVLGGWIDDADAVLGVEVALDGGVKVGQDLEEAIVPFVSGRWGLGWTASRRGFETTDGGMTWRSDIELPEPLVKAPAEAACGPLGCISSGWLRVGWGSSQQHVADDPASSWRTASRAPPPLVLDCEARTPLAPTEEAKAEPLPVRRPTGSFPTPDMLVRAPVLPPLGAHKAPKVPAGDQGISVDSRVGMQRTQHGEELARVYAWGPSSGDWDLGGRWQVLWQWPWGAWHDVRSSAEAGASWSGVEVARQAIGLGGVPLEWSLTVDDADHALLSGRRNYGSARGDLVVLETNRPPLEVRGSRGEPVAELDGAVRMAGHWYLATPQASGELPALVVWLVDGGTAREIARLPRLGIEPRASVRLASREDGRTLGVVVDGEPSTDGAPAARWVFPVDAETGAVSEPEPLGAADLSDRPLTLCTAEDTGWQLELPYPSSVQVRIGPLYRAYLQSPYARIRLSQEAACMERLLGSVEPWSARPPESVTERGAAEPFGRAAGNVATSQAKAASTAVPASVDVSVLSARMRYLLRCAHR
jgi:hypothetical protein